VIVTNIGVENVIVTNTGVENVIIMIVINKIFHFSLFFFQVFIRNENITPKVDVDPIVKQMIKSC